MRKRHEQFVEAFTDELVGCVNEESAMIASGKKLGWVAGEGPMKDHSIVARAKALLNRPDVLEAIRERIELTTGFTQVEADAWLIKHIRGDVEVEKVFVNQGEVIRATVKEPPSLKALEIYKRSTEPQPTKTVNVNQRSLVARINVGDDPPGISPRKIDS